MDFSARVIGSLGVLCIGALGAALLGGCVSVSEYRKLERDVRTLQAKQSGTGGREQVADLGARMDSLQADLQRLEGRLEVVEHNTQDALNEARKARREANDPSAPPQASPPAGAPEPPPLGATTRPGSPQVAAAVPVSPAPPQSGPAPADDGASKKGASAEEVQAYRAAFAAWQRNDTNACIDQFGQFLQAHPTSIYADDSAYWMADCYFKKGDYKTAVLRFDDVVARYPKGNKAADALYRHGESLARLGPGYSKAALRAFQRVMEEYPDSPRAAEAKKQIELLGGTPPATTGSAAGTTKPAGSAGGSH
ncbi:MAG TPA: outer membrane protein assembly factor BamD [Myxococcota bacterium]|nr:outer membrane protein assembly factor BamD [Myxococcota bacterium]